jgi:hypothetical protein
MALPSLRFTEERRRERYPNIQGAWGFDEGGGAVAADSTGNTGLVLTTNGSMNLAVTGATWVAGHTIGNALENAGTSVVASVVVNLSSSALTIMGWVRPLNLTSGSNRPLFGIWDSTDALGSTFVAVWAQRGDFGTPNVLQGNVRAGGSLNAINSAATLTVGTWSHVALTYNGSNMFLYKDGVQVGTTAQSAAAYTGAAVFNVLPTPANAQADDVRVFDTALSQAQIAEMMTQPVVIP